MKRRIFVDTEWTAEPWSEGVELMWVGLGDEEGRTWYGISSEVEIDPEKNDFISGVFRLITPEEPRMTRLEMAKAIIEFCGDVDEFWAWIPMEESFSKWFDLGPRGPELYAKYWNWDLQMLQSLVQPWPAGWPSKLQNLCTAAADSGVELPPRAENHLHPRVHSEWNQDLFKRIRAVSAL